jgi:histidinol phosphatase-like enzyme (inositol monophosphatase family)
MRGGLTPPTHDIAALLSAAHAAADAARPQALAWFRDASLTADNKRSAGFDPVTEADRASERAIRETLARLRPDDAIRGEEEPDRPGTSGVEWVIDPIDGTRAFLCGAPSWGVLIAANLGGRPMIGLIDQPFTGERFEGVLTDSERRASWRRGAETRRLATRACAALSDATLLTTFPEIGTEAERQAFARVRDRVRLTRYGLDCYGYALVALGGADLVIEAGLAAYDVQALMPVVEGAGGVVTDWRGGDCSEGGRVLAAGDPALHAEAVARLAGA